MTLLNSVLRRFRSREWLVNEFWKTFRYGVVGVVSLLMHAAIYALLSRLVWEEGNRTVQYVIALVTASIFNFTAHRLWTFAISQFSTFMLVRYVVAVLLGMGLQSVIFHVVYEVFGYADTIAFAVSIIISIMFSYFVHRFFTYNMRFERNAAIVEEVVEETVVEVIEN